MFKNHDLIVNGKLIRPKIPKDCGYSFCFLSGCIPLVGFTLETNGFVIKDYNSSFTIAWGIKREPDDMYQMLAPY